MPSSFDRYSQVPLMLSTGSCLAAGPNAAMLRQITTKLIILLVIGYFFLYAKGAYMLPPAEAATLATHINLHIGESSGMCAPVV